MVNEQSFKFPITMSKETVVSTTGLSNFHGMLTPAIELQSLLLYILAISELRCTNYIPTTCSIILWAASSTAQNGLLHKI